MSYRHYETECFVISLSGERGANRSAFLLSRDFGPIWAHAQGLRREQSKLRYSLQAPAKTRVVLIKGKEIWRIVGAEEGENYWRNLKGKKDDNENLRLVSRLFNFLEKILVGEDADEKLFLVIEGLINFLKEREGLKREELSIAELIIVGRIMYRLGFLSFEEAKDVLERTNLTLEDVTFVSKEHKKFLQAVNESLKASYI